MATLYSRLYSEFNTNWDTGVIAKPTFVDGRFQRYAKGNAVIFDTMELSNAAQVAITRTETGTTLIDKKWTFGIECVANTDANLELLLEQSLVRLLTYSGTNIKWWVESVGAFSSKYGQRACYINCSETAVVTTAAW